MAISSKTKIYIGIGVVVVLLAIVVWRKKASSKKEEAAPDPRDDEKRQLGVLSQEIQGIKAQVQTLTQQIMVLSSRPVPSMGAGGGSGLMFTEKRGQPEPQQQQQQQRVIPQDSPFSNLGGSMSAMSLDFGPNGGISLGK